MLEEDLQVLIESCHLVCCVKDTIVQKIDLLLQVLCSH